MIDPAVMLMEACYGIMCIQYGWHKMREALYLSSRKGLALVLTFAVYTALAPYSIIDELVIRVK